MQMANLPAMPSPQVVMPDVSASTLGNKRVAVETTQEPLNKKRKDEINGQQQTVAQTASERQQPNDNARSRYDAPESRFRRDSQSSRDARHDIRDRRDDHYDSRDRRDDHTELRDRRSSMSTPERRDNNDRLDGQLNRRENSLSDRREGGESRPRQDIRARLESGATQRTTNAIIYESVTSRPAETQPRPAAANPPEAPATVTQTVVTLKPETVVVTKQQPTATLADQFKDSKMTPVSNRTDTIVLEASPDDEEPGQLSETPVGNPGRDHATTKAYSGWPQSPSPSKSVPGQTMSRDSSRRTSPARTVATTIAGSPSNITIQVSTSNSNDESVTREVALETIGNERRVVDTTSMQQRPYSRVLRSIVDRLQSERKFSDHEIIFEVLSFL